MKRPQAKAPSALPLVAGIALVAVFALVVALVVNNLQSGAGAAVPEYTSLEELQGKRIGTIAGSVYADLVAQKLSGVSADNIHAYNNAADMVSALQAREIDALVESQSVASSMLASNDSLARMPDELASEEIGIALHKNSDLTAKFNERLEALSLDGTMDVLREKWFTPSDETKTLSTAKKVSPNGVLRVVCANIAPMAYLQDDKTVMGYEVELVQTIASDLGYSAAFYSAPFASMLKDVEDGKADVAIGNITVTPERRERVDFTVPDCSGEVVLVTRASNEPKRLNPAAGIIRSFRRDFIDESRWKVILGGLGVTAAISAITAVLGAPLALLLVRMRYAGGRLATRFIGLFQSLMGGVPVVVIIMVLYYVVFGTVDVAGEFIATLAFVLVFAGKASALLWGAIEGIDEGQREAALALGYEPAQVYSKVIYPQAIASTMPRLVSLYVGTVKETAAVGYIAVQDLTRASDFIRARTMDAFFPLVATALIYFVICHLLGVILNKLGARYIAWRRRRAMGEESQ